MARSLYGGGAVLTGALLLSSLVFTVHPSVAENLASLDTEKTTEQGVNLAGKSLPTDVAAATASRAAQNSNNLDKSPTLASAKLNSNSVPEAFGKDGSSALTFLAAENYTATAYSLPGRTASGVGVRRGLIAADRRVLPLGARVRVEAGAYSGEYVVADRGSAVRGHIIDIWVPSTREAMRFGRRPVRLTVLSYGSRPAPGGRTDRARR
ncbi:MAG: 3D domain-containing protein [Acidobacteria bacterium]|nr:3D domain-containing protein [Acidobacteriota bacterium]